MSDLELMLLVVYFGITNNVEDIHINYFIFNILVKNEYLRNKIKIIIRNHIYFLNVK